jgi:hypothetical protein
MNDFEIIYDGDDWRVIMRELSKEVTKNLKEFNERMKWSQIETSHDEEFPDDTYPSDFCDSQGNYYDDW